MILERALVNESDGLEEYMPHDGAPAEQVEAVAGGAIVGPAALQGNFCILVDSDQIRKWEQNLTFEKLIYLYCTRSDAGVIGYQSHYYRSVLSN